MQLTVDRIEGDYAVCELPDCTLRNVLLSALPKGTKEGSIIELNDDEFSLNAAAEEERRNILFELQDSLFTE